MNWNKKIPPKPDKNAGEPKVPAQAPTPDDDEEDGDIATPKRDRDDEDQAGV